MILIAHSILGVALLSLGNLLSAREHFERSIALYHPEHHRFIAALFGDNPGVACRSFVATELGFLLSGASKQKKPKYSSKSNAVFRADASEHSKERPSHRFEALIGI